MQKNLPWVPILSSGTTLTTALFAWLAARSGLAPLSAVANSARGIDMNSLEQRPPLKGVPIEVTPLVEAINEALARLDASAARMRRYTANLAHELRTPLAILRARLENAEEPSFKSDLRRDASRLQAIVEQMLIAACLTEQQVAVDQEIDLVETVKSVLSD